MYAIFYLGDAVQHAANPFGGYEPAICESYDGMQYDIYATRRGAERSHAVLEARYPGSYRVIPLPGYPAADTEFSDPVYCHPYWLENPDLTDAQIDAYYATRDL